MTRCLAMCLVDTAVATQATSRLLTGVETCMVKEREEMGTCGVQRESTYQLFHQIILCRLPNVVCSWCTCGAQL